MPKFVYKAYAPTGGLEQRVASGATAAAVQRDLTGKGYRLVSLRPARNTVKDWARRSLPSLYGVKPREVMQFSRQLSTFLRVGVPITDGIRLLQDGSGSSGFKAALDDILEDLTHGNSFSQALAKHPEAFSRVYIDTTRAAEASGTVDRALAQMARYLQRQESALKKLRNAMIYPAVVFSLAIVVVAILLTFVLPNFLKLFADFHATLPLPTRILLAIGSFGSTYRLYIAVVLLVIAFGSFFFFKSAPGRQTWQRLSLRLPVIGPIITYAVIERFIRTLAASLDAGVPIAPTFDVAIAASGNYLYQQRLQGVKQRMVRGEGFSLPLSQTKLFDPMLIRMIRVGEETGTLGGSLEQIAEFLAEEIDYKVKNMIALIEPGMVIFVGAIVLFIGVSVITPMYSILHQIK